MMNQLWKVYAQDVSEIVKINIHGTILSYSCCELSYFR